MFKLIDFISEAGSSNHENEDLLWYRDNIIIFLDGSSTLFDPIISTKEFMKLFIEIFIEFLEQTNDLRSSIVDSIRKIRLNFESRDIEITAGNIPSAAALFIYQNNNTLQVVNLGDCIALFFKENTLIEITDHSVERLDNLVINEALNIQKKTKEDLDVIMKKSIIKDLLIENRLKMNSANGYQVLALNLDSIPQEDLFEIPTDQVERIILYTDGFKFLRSKIKSNDFLVQDLYKELRNIENSDRSLNKYPRLKISDDATLAVFDILN